MPTTVDTNRDVFGFEAGWLSEQFQIIQYLYQRKTLKILLKIHQNTTSDAPCPPKKTDDKNKDFFFQNRFFISHLRNSHPMYPLNLSCASQPYKQYKPSILRTNKKKRICFCFFQVYFKKKIITKFIEA